MKDPMKIIFCLLFPFIICAQDSLKEIDKLIESKQYQKAEKMLLEHCDDHPKDYKSIELLADTYGNQEKWDEAIPLYRNLVETFPKNANYHYKYGGSMGLKALKVNKFKALTMIDDIKDAFRTAAELDPNHIDTRWALVELYMQLPGIIGGSMEKSMHYANELQEISKVDGYLAKGYIYEYDDDAERAELYYKAAIKIGGSLTCYDKLTKLYEDQNQPQKAIENLEEAQIKHKRNALHYQIGKVAAEYEISLDKGEFCLQTYIKNYKVSDGVPIAWAQYRLAQIYKFKGDKNQALKHIDLAIKDLPSIKTFKREKEKIMRL